VQATAHRSGLTHLTLAIAGIFGANPTQIPKIKIGQIGENNSSSVQGGARTLLTAVAQLSGCSQDMCRVAIAGIFAEPAAFQATPRTSQLTYSSVQGGIFADTAPRSSPDMRPKPKVRHTVTEEDAVAGKKMERDTQAPLQPLKTSRTNANSIQDGIFSKQAPTPVKQQRAATYNHNQSSVQGGIFGC
jgi:hypothetical protein